MLGVGAIGAVGIAGQSSWSPMARQASGQVALERHGGPAGRRRAAGAVAERGQRQAELAMGLGRPWLRFGRAPRGSSRAPARSPWRRRAAPRTSTARGSAGTTFRISPRLAFGRAPGPNAGAWRHGQERSPQNRRARQRRRHEHRSVDFSQFSLAHSSVRAALAWSTRKRLELLGDLHTDGERLDRHDIDRGRPKPG